MGIFAKKPFIGLITISFGLAATIPTPMLSITTNALICSIVDGKIYVNNAYRGKATMKNIEEAKVYNEEMRKWTKSLHDAMYMTMQKMVDNMFGEHGAFWRHLHGPFWEAVNAYGPDSDLMIDPLGERKQQKKIVLKLPELPPYPEAPSFCME
ncbi:unnamed protein product [Litomosoides sigmodontis]|uniref:Pepsin inhibitor-3-like repeated domain-containing protein n=1 Tax=Litomosoides sigmodontis TaxID=42156 RepID=A0A3P6SHR2_LITSI|nr:unnamed protein product [Litomosoides sigmodontis]